VTETLHPSYFAMVMATGIVSIACHLFGYTNFALGLFWLNVVALPCLCLLTGLRLAWYPRRFLADLSDHSRGVGFFTVVAATGVFGTQLVVQLGAPQLAVWFWGLAIVLCLLLTYAIFTCLTIKTVKPTLAEGINGAWLVTVVATQSLSVLGSQLAGYLEPHHESVLFFSLACWLAGGMLYIWMISLIFYRYTFFVMNPADLTPPYWINMGAVAISTLAGTFLVAEAERFPFLASLLPFLKGMTLLYWSTATWWIPMLATLGIWRHVFCRFPLQYGPLYWGGVFPLGMYTACTYRLSAIFELPFLMPIARYMLIAAVMAWGLTFYGFLRSVIRLAVAGTLRLRRRESRGGVSRK